MKTSTKLSHPTALASFAILTAFATLNSTAAVAGAQAKPLQMFGPACGAKLEGTKTAMRGSYRLDLQISDALRTAPVTLIFGTHEKRVRLPGGSCVLLTDPALHVPVFTDAGGRAKVSFTVPSLGTAAYSQAMPIDLAGRRVVASNGVQLFGGRASPSACPPNTCSGSQMIIGCDNRKRGPTSGSTSKKPWNMVGKIYINGQPSGSGTLIGARYVLTAAHVVYNSGGFKSGNIGFALAQTAQHCSKRPLGTRYVKRVFVPRDYSGSSISASNKALDYAVLELVNPILGGHVMQVQHLSWNTLKNRQTTAIGYPGTPLGFDPFGSAYYCRGSFASSQPYKWYSGGKKGTLRCSNDGTGGMSGGPLYVWHSGKRKLVGVFIGSPISECQNGHVWAARMTPNAVTRIHNAKLFPPNGNVIDFFWRWHSPTTLPDINYGCGS